MSADTELSNQYKEIATKVISLSEDGPGEYSIMIQLIEVRNHRPLERVGFGGVHTLFTRLDSPPYTADYDARRLLMRDNFTGKDSVIDDFLTSISDKPTLFHRLVDGEKYTPEMMEGVIDGPG